jgi:hypothetical protein
MRIAFYENGKPTLVGAGGLMLKYDERGWFSLQDKQKIYYTECKRVIRSGMTTLKLGDQIKRRSS